jgi:ABC-2 type transport system permease protein
MGFILAVVVLEAGPVYTLFMAGIRGRSLSFFQWVWLGGSLALVLLLSVWSVLFSLRFGEKRLNTI